MENTVYNLRIDDLYPGDPDSKITFEFIRMKDYIQIPDCLSDEGDDCTRT